MECDYTFDEDEFEDISETAKEFIEKLLVVKQENRMSADDALLHPWLSSSSTSQWAQN